MRASKRLSGSGMNRMNRGSRPEGCTEKSKYNYARISVARTNVPQTAFSTISFLLADAIDMQWRNAR